MPMCESDPASFIRIVSFFLGLFGLVSIIFPRHIMAFYFKLYALRGYNVDPDNFFWRPFMGRVYGAVTIAFAVFMYIKAPYLA